MSRIFDILLFILLLLGIAGIAACGDKIYVAMSCFSMGCFFSRYIALERRNPRRDFISSKTSSGNETFLAYCLPKLSLRISE